MLRHFVPDNDPLTGDLLEGWHERSDAWFWRQVLLAILVRAAARARAMPRTGGGELLVAAAMLALLGFHAVVAASLINYLLVLNGPEWTPTTGGYQAWQPYSTLPSFAAAVLIGRVIGRFHRSHRVAAVLACSASATVAALLNLYLFVPDVFRQPLVPDPALQIAAAMVFIAGVLIGISRRSTCEALPSP